MAAIKIETKNEGGSRSLDCCCYFLLKDTDFFKKVFDNKVGLSAMGVLLG